MQFTAKFEISTTMGAGIMLKFLLGGGPEVSCNIAAE